MSDATATNNNLLQAARSQDGSLVAVATPTSNRLTIQVYQVESSPGVLKTTLTTAKAKSARAISFCGNDHVVAQASTGNSNANQILIWNLTRGGVVSHTLVAEAGKRFLEVVCHQAHVFVLVGITEAYQKKSSRRSSASGVGTYHDDDDDDNEGDNDPSSSSGPLKLQIHQYEPTSGRLVRKFKCGKTDGSKHNTEVGFAVQLAAKGTNGKDASSLQFLVRCGNSKEAFRIIDAETGDRLAKHKYRDHKKQVKKDGSGGNGIFVCGTIVAIPRRTCVALFHLQSNEWMESIPLVSSSNSGIAGVHLWQEGDQDSDVLLLVGQILYRCTGSTATVVQKIQSEHELLLLPRFTNSQVLIAVLHSPSSGTQVQTVDCAADDNDNDDGEMTIQWRDPSDGEDAMDVDAVVEGGDNNPNKRSTMTVLGPGQAGAESATVSDVTSRKKQKTITEEEEESTAVEGEEEDASFGMSIADRLQKLTQVLKEEAQDDPDDDDEDEDGNPKEKDTRTLDKTGKVVTHREYFASKATTESLSELLTQALEGGVDGALEIGLAVQNRNILRETIDGLSEHCLNLLLTKLTTRMAKKPARAEELVAWFSIIIASGRIREPKQLQPLRNLVEERVSTFPLILRLEGRCRKY